MRLLSWLVLSILLVESLQKKDSRKTTPGALRTTEAEEGSGEDSSEERTEETTIEKKSNVPIVPLDDATDSDEAIKKALTRNSPREKPENSTERKSSDLVVLGENSAPETGTDRGENSSQTLTRNDDPMPFRSSLSNGKLREEIVDTITISPDSGEIQDEGKIHSHKEPPLNHGKSGAEVDDGELSDNDDQVLDGKLGGAVREAAVPPLDKIQRTTIVDHETSTSTTTVPSAPTTTPSKEATSAQQETEIDATASTPSSDGKTSTAQTASSTTSNTPVDPDKPGINAENIDKFNKMDFQGGAQASCKSTEACSQNLTKLQCVGAYCDEVSISVLTCNREKNLELSNVTSIRFTVPIQWSCGSSDSEPDFLIRNSSVVCEGYNHPGDHWIVQNSCILHFSLHPGMNSSALRIKDNGSRNSAVAIILIMLAMTGMGYFMIKAVILKRRHGHWVPSYCTFPLKARMNFRRRRQTKYDEEPVNVHFDMGEEQTNIGRNRVRSYGPQ